MLLNGAALNGAGLDGSPLIVLEGAAAFDCAAIASFTAHLEWSGAATLTCGGEMVANATRGVRPEVVMQCTAAFTPVATHEQMAGASFDASAGVTAYVLRTVEASAGFDCAAFFDAVVQGYILTAGAVYDFAGTAALSAGATKVISGGYSEAAECTAQFVPTASITRSFNGMAAGFSGSSKFTAAYRVGTGPYTYYSGAEIDCSGELETISDYIFYNITAVFDCASPTVDGAPFVTEPGYAGFDVAAEMTALLGILVFPSATLECAATVTPDATRTQYASSTAILGTADFTGSLHQEHTGTVAFDSSCDFTATSVVVCAGVAMFDTNGGLEVVALRNVLPSATMDSASDLWAICYVSHTYQGAANFDCMVDIASNARTNMDADDPPERTMRRPYSERTLRRPFVDRVMKEAA